MPRKTPSPSEPFAAQSCFVPTDNAAYRSRSLGGRHPSRATDWCQSAGTVTLSEPLSSDTVASLAEPCTAYPTATPVTTAPSAAQAAATRCRRRRGGVDGSGPSAGGEVL